MATMPARQNGRCKGLEQWESIMPQLPVNIENDVTIQNNTTGQVDYLQFQGNTLTQSALFDYGIAGWNIVSSDFNGPTGLFTLVAQNPTTGLVDFLGLDRNGNLVSSLMSSSLPPIVGHGFFGSPVPSQSGNELISQLANGELDFLAFNSSGKLIASDLVANSIGLPHVVGAATATGLGPAFEAFSGIGTNVTAMNLITQLTDGSLDVIGFSGDFAAGTLSFSNSFLLPGSAGSAPVEALNPDAGGRENISDSAGHQGVQMVSQLASGQLDFLSFDSGYHDAANEGALYASNLLTPSFPGWHPIDGGFGANQIFPIT
jgi:hypothetical protein